MRSPAVMMLILAWAATQAASAQEQIVVRAGFKLTDEAERELARTAEPTRFIVNGGEDPLVVGRKLCPTMTPAYLELLEAANRDDGLSVREQAREVVYPACFVIKPPSVERRLSFEGLRDFAQRVLANSGPKTMKRLGTINGSLFTQAGDPISEIKVPFSAPPVVYTLNAKSAEHPDQAITQIANALGIDNSKTPQLTPSTGLTPMIGIILRKPVDCVPGPVPAAWPFDPQAVAQAVERNRSYRIAHGLPDPSPVVVAVADNGVAGLRGLSFPDGLLFINPGEKPENNKDDEGNGFVDDFTGVGLYAKMRAGPAPAGAIDRFDHGTVMANLVLGGPSWRTLSAGGPALRLMTINMVDRVVTTRGESYDYPSSGLQKALDYATRYQADILNFSVGTSDFDPGLAALLRQSNILVVAAAGNDANDYRLRPIYPAAYGAQSGIANGHVISVGAMEPNGCLATFSGRGLATIDIAAPGVSIASPGTDGTPRTDDGTSQAAALVSFTAALIKAQGIIDIEAIRDRLYATATQSPNLIGYVRSGGALNVPDAVSVTQDIVYAPGSSIPEYGSLDQSPGLAELCEDVSDADDVRILRITGSASKLQILIRRINDTNYEPFPCAPSKASTGLWFTPNGGTRREIVWADLGTLIPR